MQQKLMELRREIDKPIIMIQYLNTPISQKIRMDTEYHKELTQIDKEHLT